MLMRRPQFTTDTFAPVRRLYRPIEGLEARTFLSTAQPNFADFSSTDGLVSNGFGSNSIQNGSTLQLTGLSNHEARSVWWSKKVAIDSFTTHFSIVTDNSLVSADGLTFTIQNGSTSSLGSDGANLGYTGINKSVALGFNIYNNSLYGSQFGFASNGQKPATNTNMSPADLHDGDTYNATVSYDGTTLTLNLVDASDSSKHFTASEQINIAQTIGSDNAIVGFTAATGAQFSPQAISSWTYRGSNYPTVVTPATASSATVVGSKVGLSVLGGDSHGESTLKYNWSLVTMPKGAKRPTFTANGSNSSKQISAKFFKAGTYVFRCTITNSLGLSSTSDVTVVVDQTLTSLRLIPHIRIVHPGDHLNFKGATYDQFGHTMPTQPTITYSIQTGSGTINPVTGHYVAGGSAVHLVIAATGDGLTGTVGGTLEPG